MTCLLCRENSPSPFACSPELSGQKPRRPPQARWRFAIGERHGRAGHCPALSPPPDSSLARMHSRDCRVSDVGHPNVVTSETSDGGRGPAPREGGCSSTYSKTSNSPRAPWGLGTGAGSSARATDGRRRDGGYPQFPKRASRSSGRPLRLNYASDFQVVRVYGRSLNCIQFRNGLEGWNLALQFFKRVGQARDS